MEETRGRRGYLDWMRGLGVLIMIEAHVLDSWTRLDVRQSRPFVWAMILGGFGAPLFLFLHYWDPHTPYGPRPPYDTVHYRPGSGPVDLADVIAIAPEYYRAFLADMKLRQPDDFDHQAETGQGPPA